MKLQGIKIVHRKDGRWQFKKMLNNKVHFVIDRTQKGCFDKATNLLKEIKQTPSNELVSKSIKLYEWLDIWYNTYKITKLKKSSLYQIKTCINTHIKKNIENIKLCDIKPIDIDNALNKIQSSRMKKYTYDTIRDCLRTAYKNSITKINISDLLEKVIHRRAEGKALTRDQFNSIKKFVNSRPGYEIFVFYMFTGCRKSEALNMRWDYIKDNTIFLPGTKSENAPRKIPLFAQVKNCLSKLTKESEKIFNITQDTLRRKKETIQKHCKFKFNIKDLRTTFATYCEEIGIDNKVFSKWLGHGDIKTTMKYYVKPLEDFELRQIEKFDTNFDTKNLQ